MGPCMDITAIAAAHTVEDVLIFDIKYAEELEVVGECEVEWNAILIWGWGQTRQKV